MSNAWALGIFVVTFLLLAAGCLGRVRIERGPTALFGGLLMLMVGAVGPIEVMTTVDIGVLALLLGMMLLTAALGESGFFDLIAGTIVKRARNERHLVWATLLSSALLSALFFNALAALFVTPVVFLMVRWAGVAPLRPLLAVALGVQIGGLATPVGTPQASFLVSTHQIGFVDYAAHMAPIVLVGLLVAGVLLTAGASRVPFRPAPDLSTVLRRLPLTLATIALAFTLVMFLLAPRTGMPLWAIAATSGVMVLVMVPFLMPDGTSTGVTRRVNGNLLMLFAGLYLLLQGASNAGLVELAYQNVMVGGDGLLAHAELGALTALLTGVLSAVPAVFLMEPHIAGFADPLLAQLVAASSVIGGLATPVASAATLTVAEFARQHNEDISFWAYTKTGAAVAGAMLAVTVPYFAWLAA